MSNDDKVDLKDISEHLNPLGYILERIKGLEDHLLLKKDNENKFIKEIDELKKDMSAYLNSLSESISKVEDRVSYLERHVNKRNKCIIFFKKLKFWRK
jgi:hypothetical protein